MQKMYPCIFITQDEIQSVNNGRPALFKNTYLTQPELYQKLEDYLGIPIISIQPSVRSRDFIFVFYADGFIQYNPSSRRRMAVINGEKDYIIRVITDMMTERTRVSPGTSASAVLGPYTFHTTPRERMEIKQYIQQTYGD